MSDGTRVYDYDAEGNTIRKTHLSTDEIWEYTYNSNNRLILAEHKPDAQSAVDLRVEFVYDILGNRIARIVDADGDGNDPAVETRFAYDMYANAWADLDDQGSLTTRRIFGEGMEALIARIDDSGDVAWYLTDMLGSVRDIADDAGDLATHIDYSAFGEIIYVSQAGIADRYGFTAREHDEETGLIYYRARYLFIENGRWTSEDPIGFRAGDANVYRYVGNNPANATDPSGLAPLWTLEGLREVGEGFIAGPVEIVNIVSDVGYVIQLGRDTNAGGDALRRHIGPNGQLVDFDSALFQGGTDAIRRGEFGSWYGRTMLSVGTLGLWDMGDALVAGDTTRYNRSLGGFLFVVATAGTTSAARGRGWNGRRVPGPAGQQPPVPANALANQGVAFNRANAAVGQIQRAVNPRTLRPGARRMLDRGRYRRIVDDLGGGIREPLQVTREGVIVQGHHRARVAAERGLRVDVEVVDAVQQPGPVPDVLDLEFFN